MNDFRKRWVERAFKRLDPSARGTVSLDDLKASFSPELHPDAKSGVKTEQAVFMEFMETLETHHNVLMGKGKDKNVTKDEFDDYYGYISPGIESDEHFALILRQVWKLDEVPSQPLGHEDIKQPKPSRTQIKNMSSADNTLKASVVQEATRAPSASASGTVIAKRPTGEVGMIMERWKKGLAGRGARALLGLLRQFQVQGL
jgi:hypothetical protein